MLSNKEHGENDPGLQETTMPARKTDKTSKPAVRKPAKRTAAPGKVATTLPEAMTGRASPAKAAVGDKPVFAYIASLPQPQRGIAESVDALAAKTLPGLQRSVKWGMSYYGVGDGWCFCCGGFAGHVKLMFVNGAALKPVPPVTPVGMGKSTRGVELESVDDIDESQIAAWMKQVAAVPGVGGKSDKPRRKPARGMACRSDRPSVEAPEHRAAGSAPGPAYRGPTHRGRSDRRVERGAPQSCAPSWTDGLS